MDTNQLDKIEKHTRATKNAAKVLAEFFIYSAVALIVGGGLAVLALLIGESVEVAVLIALVVGGLGQIFVIFRAFGDVRAL